jgi:cathepsin F
MYSYKMNTTQIVLLLFVLSSCLAVDAVLYDKFQNFINRFNKTYSTVEEYNFRFNLFQENYRKLEDFKHAIEAEMTNSTQLDNDTLTLDVTGFFDLSQDEFEHGYLTTSVSEDDAIASSPNEEYFITGNETETEKLRHLESLPENFDWREFGAVSPVKTQRSCGACYAFSSVANLESLYYIKYNKTINLSEQQIVNCNPYSVGCNGGNVALVFKYLINRSSGLGLEKSARYVARKETCAHIEPVVKVKKIVYAGTKNEDYIASFLMKHGVLSIALNASMFNYYSRGIMNYPDTICSPRKLNHAVNIVGFGISARGVKYWVVRNTWGPTWGEDGYVRIARGTCGVNSYVMTGVIE